MQPLLDQVVRHLETDKAAAHDHHGLGLFRLHVVGDAVRVGYIPEAENMGKVDAGNGRPDRLRSGGEDDAVVAFPVRLPRPEVPDLDLFVRPVYLRHLGEDAYVDVVALREIMDGRHEELLPLRDYPSDVVWQTAIGKRDVLPPLEKDDVGPLVEPPGPCCRGRTACNASDDQ